MKWLWLTLGLLACSPTEPCDTPPSVYRWPAPELIHYGVTADDAIVIIRHNCLRYVCQMFHATAVPDEQLMTRCTQQWVKRNWP